MTHCDKHYWCQQAGPRCLQHWGKVRKKSRSAAFWGAQTAHRAQCKSSYRNDWSRTGGFFMPQIPGYRCWGRRNIVSLRPLWVWSPLRGNQLVTETVRMWGVSRRLTIASLLGQHLLKLGEDDVSTSTENECYEWGEAEQEAEMQNLTRMPLVALVNTRVQFSAKILTISPRCPGQNCNFTALGCVIRASVNNAHFKSVLQSNTFAPQPWLTPWIYASVLAWDILGVNGPTVQWLTRYVIEFFSLTFMFFPKLKKASAVSHPKGLRKVKITLKSRERKWASGEECRI